MKIATDTVRVLAALSIPFGMATATLALAAFLASAPVQHQHRRGPGIVTILNDTPETARAPQSAVCTAANAQNCS
jgi:hypothetical protein